MGRKRISIIFTTPLRTLRGWVGMTLRERHALQINSRPLMRAYISTHTYISSLPPTRPAISQSSDYHGPPAIPSHRQLALASTNRVNHHHIQRTDPSKLHRMRTTTFGEKKRRHTPHPRLSSDIIPVPACDHAAIRGRLSRHRARLPWRRTIFQTPNGLPKDSDGGGLAHHGSIALWHQREDSCCGT